MNSEDTWAKCHVDVANAALGIAREYGHPWAHSSVVPQAGGWEPEDKRPTLEEIRMHIPCRIARGVLTPRVSYDENGWVVRFKTPDGRATIQVSHETDRDTEYSVTVWRSDGSWARGTKSGHFIMVGADDSRWGMRHMKAWQRAWRAIGIEPPEFPGVLRAEWDLIVDADSPLPTAPEDISGATVQIMPSALLTGRDLLKLVQYARHVIVRDDDYRAYPLA